MQYLSGSQMLVAGANEHASFVTPISTNSEQNAGIKWNGTPTAAEDWTVDILGHNNAGWSDNGSSALKLRVIDAASLGTDSKRSFALLMTRGATYQTGQFSTTLSGDNTDFRQTVQAFSTDFGLRLVHKGGVSGTIEAWYAATGDGNSWTLLDVISMNDFSPSMAPASTFAIFIATDCYYGPITEGAIWADNFRITNSAVGNVGPQIRLVKAVSPAFSNLMVGTNYQLQVSADLNKWTNQGSPFSATNTSMVYPQYWGVDDWSQLFFRLQVTR